MAEVGVLELTIQDNSESAGKGLDSLADALGRVKTAAGNGQGLGLGSVAQQVVRLSRIINEAVGTNQTVKNLGTLFNSISSFSKIKKINIDESSLKKIKDTFNGFNIGNAGSQIKNLADAMKTDWTATGVADSMQVIVDAGNAFAANDTATKMGAVTKAMKDYATAYKNLPNKDTKMVNLLKQLSDSGLFGGKASGKTISPAKELADYFASANAVNPFEGTALGRNKLNLQQFGRRKQVAGQMEMNLDAIMPKASASIKSVMPMGKETIEEVSVLSSKLAEIHDRITSKDYMTGGAADLPGIFREASGGARDYRDAIVAATNEFRQMSEEELIVAGNARAATRAINGLLDRLNERGKPGKMYGEYVAGLTGFTRQPYSAERSMGAFVDQMAVGFDTVPVKTYNIELRETKDLVESVVTGINEIGGVAPENMLSTWVDYGKQWAPNWIEADTSIDAAKAATERIADNLGTMNEYLRNGSSLADQLASSLGNMGKGGSIIPYGGVSAFADGMKKAAEYAEATRSVAEGNILSTWVSGEENWKPDFTMGNAGDFSHLKDSAIEVEGIVMESFEHGINMFSSMEEAAKALGISVEEVKQKLNETYQMAYAPKGMGGAGGMQVFGSIEEAAQRLGITTDEVKQKLSETLQMLQGVSDAAPKVKEITAAINEAKGSGSSGNSFKPADEFIESYSHLDYLKNKLTELKDEFDARRKLGLIDADEIDKSVQQILRLQNAIKKLEEEEKKGSHIGETLSNAFRTLKSGIQKMFPTLTGLIKRFGQIAKYRALRAVLKHITSGFTEGLENVYHYSNLIGTSLAPAMDSAATAFQQLKNSVGAAVAPLVQAFIPVIRQVISVVIEGINYINQFFALLNGQGTWTRALPEAAEAYDNTAKNAKKASSATKDLLASWDELNVISSASGGSAGTIGGHTTDEYLNMFEEVGRFDSKVKEVVGYIKDHLEDILNIAKGIGKAILAWKISKAFGNSLSTLKKLSLAAGLFLTIEGIKLSMESGYSMGKDGITSENLTNSIVGLLETAIGGAMIGVALGGPGGAAIGFTIGVGISLILTGLGFLKGKNDAYLASIYGDLSVPIDLIQAEVDSLFTFDVNAKLNAATVDHTSIETAKSNIETALHEQNADYVTFKMKLTPESAFNLLKSVNNTVENANILLAGYQKKISIGFGLKFTYGDKAEEVQKFTSDKLTALERYIDGLGRDIGTILSDGIVDAIKEAPLLDELMTKLTNVTRAIQIGQASGAFTAAMEKAGLGIDWKNADKTSLENYAKAYEEEYSKVVETAMLEAQDTKAALKGVWAGMVQQKLDEPDSWTEEEINQAWENYINYNIDAVVEDYVKTATEEGRSIVVKNIMGALEEAIDKAAGSEDGIKTSTWVPGLQTTFKDTGTMDLMQFVNDTVATNLGWDRKLLQSTLALGNKTAWDLLTDDKRQLFINQIIKSVGDSPEVFKELQSDLGVTATEVFRTRKAAWGNAAEEDKFEYLKSMIDVFGASDTITALKEAKVTFDDLFSLGKNFTGKELEDFYKNLFNIFNIDPKDYYSINPNEDIDRLVEELNNRTVNGNLPDTNQLLQQYGQYGTPSVPTSGQAIDETDISSGVKKGNEQMNADLNSGLNTLISIGRQLLRKDLTVNFSPSTKAGRYISRSIEMYETIV